MSGYYRKRERILRDACTSHWLRDAIRSSALRDTVDALNDAEVLVELLTFRLELAVSRNAE